MSEKIGFGGHAMETAQAGTHTSSPALSLTTRRFPIRLHAARTSISDGGAEHGGFFLVRGSLTGENVGGDSLTYQPPSGHMAAADAAPPATTIGVAANLGYVIPAGRDAGYAGEYAASPTSKASLKTGATFY